MLVHPQFDPGRDPPRPGRGALVRPHVPGGLRAVLAAGRAAHRGAQGRRGVDHDATSMTCCSTASSALILGGRLGYVLFYKLGDYLSEPLEIFSVWHGGMSFHGGLLGVLLAMAWFASSAAALARADRFRRAAGAARARCRQAGQFHQRRAVGPRHHRALGHGFPERRTACRAIPSQLYEFALEGVLLFVILWWFSRRAPPARSGVGRVPDRLRVLSDFSSNSRESPMISLGFLRWDSPWDSGCRCR